jgi:hypothetical protein
MASRMHSVRRQTRLSTPACTGKYSQVRRTAQQSIRHTAPVCTLEMPTRLPSNENVPPWAIASPRTKQQFATEYTMVQPGVPA